VRGLDDRGLDPVYKEVKSGRYPKMVCTASGRRCVTVKSGESRRLLMPRWESGSDDVVTGAAARRAVMTEAADSSVLESNYL
jgi:hypothetical protein